MKSRFLPYQNEDTVLNYYALPLVGLSKDSFGENFVTTKVNQDATDLFVQVKSDIYPDDIYTNKIISGDNLFLNYLVPEEFQVDLRLIIDGKYSKVSPKAKHLISTTSGLYYNTRGADGYTYTSKLIFALHRDKSLKNYMFEALKTGVSQHDRLLSKALNDSELMEKVEDTDFIENI